MYGVGPAGVTIVHELCDIHDSFDQPTNRFVEQASRHALFIVVFKPRVPAFPKPATTAWIPVTTHPVTAVVTGELSHHELLGRSCTRLTDKISGLKTRSSRLLLSSLLVDRVPTLHNAGSLLQS